MACEINFSNEKLQCPCQQMAQEWFGSLGTDGKILRSQQNRLMGLTVKE